MEAVNKCIIKIGLFATRFDRARVCSAIERGSFETGCRHSLVCIDEYSLPSPCMHIQLGLIIIDSWSMSAGYTRYISQFETEFFPVLSRVLFVRAEKQATFFISIVHKSPTHFSRFSLEPGDFEFYSNSILTNFVTASAPI